MQKTKEMFTQGQSFKDNIQTQEQPARGAAASLAPYVRGGWQGGSLGRQSHFAPKH